METILEKMHEKGLLTDEEYQEMRSQAREDRRKESLRQAVAEEKAAKAKEARKVSVGPGLRAESYDGQHSVGLTGRLHFDYRDRDNEFVESNDRDSASLSNGFEIRRARIGVTGRMFGNIGYEVVTNVVGSGDLVDTAWLNLDHIKPVQLRAGRFKQPFSLEELTSSNNIDFMERSYVNQLAPQKKLGVMLHGEPVAGLTYAISRFQQGSNQTSEGEGMQSAARVTLNVSSMIDWKDGVLHLGASGTQGHYQIRPAVSSQTTSAASGTTRATIIGFNSENRGLANVYRAQIGGSVLGTAGQFAGAVDEIAANVEKEMQGLELALAYGPFKLQGEMATASFDATHQAAGQTVTGDVDTRYVEIMWNVTGENWAELYRGGVFSGIRPANNFSRGGGWGAWQVGLRLSSYDATDVTVSGANSREQNEDEGKTLTLGVNWLLNPNTKFMLNYAKTDFEGPVTPLDITGATPTPRDSETVISLRAAVFF